MSLVGVTSVEVICQFRGEEQIPDVLKHAGLDDTVLVPTYSCINYLEEDCGIKVPPFDGICVVPTLIDNSRYLWSPTGDVFFHEKRHFHCFIFRILLK